eukprot:TRINITY_DN13338_c0_g1_i3.p1 TRINITY_DN13338_c0_g1~~TRINITY_DN13338_c0_g1_i3.p1  ORF type:complete len:121 (-),score=17.26 TRINITY_DN13338_c0_g1_i3:82-444(-)
MGSNMFFAFSKPRSREYWSRMELSRTDQSQERLKSQVCVIPKVYMSLGFCDYTVPANKHPFDPGKGEQLPSVMSTINPPSAAFPDPNMKFRSDGIKMFLSVCPRVHRLYNQTRTTQQSQQ